MSKLPAFGRPAAALLAVVALLLLGRAWLADSPVTSAETALVQSATASKNGMSVSVSLRRSPQPGNLLVAVVSNRFASPVTRPPGWEVAVDETQEAPGLAVFYRVAASGDRGAFEATGYAPRNALSAQLYEYAGIDGAAPLLAAETDAGKGLAPATATLGVTAPQALVVASVVTERRLRAPDAWDGGFSLRRSSRTFFLSSSTLMTADRLLSDPSDVATGFSVRRRPTGWRSAIVAFKRADLSIASRFDRSSLGDLALSLSADDMAVGEGQVVSYLATAVNQGPAPLEDVSAFVRLPRGFAFAGSTGTGTFTPGTGEWRIDTLAAGASVTLGVRAVVPADARGSSHLTTLRAAEWVVDATGENDEAYVLVTVKGPAVASASACPAVGTPVFAVNGGQPLVKKLDVPIYTQAAGATFLLLSEHPDQYTARSYPLGPTTFHLQGEGDGKLYAWFGNHCRRTFVAERPVQYEPQP